MTPFRIAFARLLCWLRHDRRSEQHGQYLVTTCAQGCPKTWQHIAARPTRAALREANKALRSER